MNHVWYYVPLGLPIQRDVDIAFLLDVLVAQDGDG
jgi:hypothetical protein